MPIYSFSCECGHKFEAYKTVEERASAECPECQNQAKKDFPQGEILYRDWDRWQESTGWQCLPNRSRKYYPVGSEPHNHQGIRVK